MNNSFRIGTYLLAILFWVGLGFWLGSMYTQRKWIPIAAQKNKVINEQMQLVTAYEQHLSNDLHTLQKMIEKPPPPSGWRPDVHPYYEHKPLFTNWPDRIYVPNLGTNYPAPIYAPNDPWGRQ